MPSYKIVSSAIYDTTDEGEIKAMAKKALEDAGFQDVFIKSVENEREYAFVDEEKGDGADKLLAALQKEFFTETQMSFSSPIKKSWRGASMEVFPLSFDIDFTNPETRETQNINVTGQLVAVPDDVAVAFGTFDKYGDERPETEVPSDAGEEEPEGASQTGSEVSEEEAVAKRGRGRPRKDQEKNLKVAAGNHIYSWNAVAILGVNDLENAQKIAETVEQVMKDAITGPLQGYVYEKGTKTKTEMDPDSDRPMVISAGVFTSPVAPEDLPKSFAADEGRNIRGILPASVMEGI
jgi:hypothetical protein